MHKVAVSGEHLKTGQIVGTITDESTRQPVIGANILLVGTKLGATTNTEGRFSIATVPIGTYTLRISCIGYGIVSKSDVVVSTGQPTQVFAQLKEQLIELGNEVVVKGSYFTTPREIVTSVYGMDYEEIRRAPGALGDVSRLVQTMPGVVPTNDQRNDLVVRGGSPSENLTLVDNVEVPNLSHFGTQGASGGSISMLNTEFIGEAIFLAGGYPAQYGSRLSSVLNISLREGNREKFAANIDIGISGAGLILEGPLSEHGSWMFSARRSYLELIIGTVGFTAVPQYSNYQAKVIYDLDVSNKLWFVSLGGTDDIHFEGDDENNPSLVDLQSGGWRTISGLNWQSLFGKSGYGVLSISDAFNVYESDAYDAQLHPDPSAVAESGRQLIFHNRSHEGETTLKYDLVYKLDDIGDITAGAIGKLFRTSFDVKQPLGVQNRYSTDSMRVNCVALDDNFTTTQAAAYLQLTRTIGEKFDITVGARYDYFQYINDASVVSPRVSLRYHLFPNLHLNASYGIFYQMPQLIFLKADPSNRSLKPMRADHYIAGLSFFPTPDIKVTVEGYVKKYSQYPVSREYPTFSLANEGDSYSVAGLLFPLTSEGSGQSMGIEFYVQKKLTEQLYGQVSYSYSQTRHRTFDGVLRPGSFDVPHVLSIIGGFKLNEHWECSGKFTYTSGRPYTPFNLAASQAQNRPIYDLSQVNAERSPDYHRLDLRVDYRAQFGTWNLIVFLEVQNIFNKKNVFQYWWDSRKKELVTINQIAFLPMGGVRVEL